MQFLEKDSGEFDMTFIFKGKSFKLLQQRWKSGHIMALEHKLKLWCVILFSHKITKFCDNFGDEIWWRSLVTNFGDEFWWWIFETKGDEFWWLILVTNLGDEFGWRILVTNALSFYRSQNVLCWSKFFEPAQKPILLNVNLLFVWHKMFVTATICK